MLSIGHLHWLPIPENMGFSLVCKCRHYSFCFVTPVRYYVVTVDDFPIKYAASVDDFLVKYVKYSKMWLIFWRFSRRICRIYRFSRRIRLIYWRFSRWIPVICWQFLSYRYMWFTRWLFSGRICLLSSLPSTLPHVLRIFPYDMSWKLLKRFVASQQSQT